VRQYKWPFHTVFHGSCSIDLRTLVSTCCTTLIYTTDLLAIDRTKSLQLNSLQAARLTVVNSTLQTIVNGGTTVANLVPRGGFSADEFPVNTCEIFVGDRLFKERANVAVSQLRAMLYTAEDWVISSDAADKVGAASHVRWQLHRFQEWLWTNDV
jgi:hypothetical protein